MWQRLLTIALGLWLMVAPDVLPANSASSVIDRIAGPVAIFVGVLALRAVTRPIRVLNVLTGMFLLILPWVATAPGAMLWNAELCGWLLIVLALPQGAVRQRVGGGWLAVARPEIGADEYAPEA